MFHRDINLLNTNSFFLFGARGTGKTTLLERRFEQEQTLYINLLDPLEEEAFSLDPLELKRRVEALSEQISFVFIDEIQKVPKLLDLVQQLMHEHKELIFGLTGSSARKLRRGGANLLAGRAFVYHLYPLSHRELGESFDLHSVLRWGTLPRIYELETDEERQLYLRTYANAYLKEEIQEEQLVRKLDPFRRFLQVAAQSSGQIINFSKIGRDVGVDTKTVQSYFQILEDTLLGVFLPPFHESVRKRQFENPKFYLFDTGVKRALDRTITVDLLPQNYGYGIAFEHFVFNEMYKLQHYRQLDFEFSYLRTYDDAEIDLVIERPGENRALVEIKSKDRIEESDIKHLLSLGKDIPRSEMFCLSQDPHRKLIDGVLCLPWQEGIKEIGL